MKQTLDEWNATVRALEARVNDQNLPLAERLQAAEALKEIKTAKIG